VNVDDDGSEEEVDTGPVLTLRLDRPEASVIASRYGEREWKSKEL
jgi:hypothetical protein